MSSVCSVAGCNLGCHIGKTMCLEHYKERGDYEFGLDAEIKKKIAGKFDPAKQAQAQAWLEALTGEMFPSNFHESLKSGVILCTAINVIKPGSVRKITRNNMAFMQRENIVAYLNACKALGMRETDLFVTQDLFEGDNLVQVVDQIHALGSLSRKVAGFGGPYIGVKQADKNVRNFTKEQLAKNRVVGTKITQGSFGYQDDTKNASLDRQIVKNVTGIKASEAASKFSTGSYGTQDTNISVARSDKIIKQSQELDAQRGGKAAAAVSKPTSGGAKFCANCGTARGSGKFCGNCGTKF